MKPFDLFHPERRSRVKLYVKRVFITDEGVELLPAYLRFMRGVIDSEDLPLNVSRETLQDNPLLAKIRDAVTKKTLGEIAKKAQKDAEGFAQFWKNFGPVLKEGLCESLSPKDKIFDVCRFASTQGDDLVSLKDYVGRMIEGQEAVYYLNGDNLETLRKSPQLEGFKARGIEVLLLTDHVDDFWINATPFYDGKPFRSVIRSGNDLDSINTINQTETDDKNEALPEIDGLITKLKSVYGEAVRNVRVTAKLADSPVCLAVNEHDMDMRMERFLVEHRQLPQASARILEINPHHPIIRQLAKKSAQDADIADTAWLLLDQAKILEGEPIADPASFAIRLNQLLTD